MEHKIELLSEEMLDLSTSFDTTANFDESFQMTPQVSEGNLNNIDTTLNSLDNSLSFQKNGTVNDSYNSTGICEDLSQYYGRSPSIPKIMEVKQAMMEANEAHSLWMISQLMLDSCKISEQHVRPELASRIREVRSASKLKQFTQMKSRKGEVLNILGLEDADIEAETGKLLSTAESKELRDHAEPVLKTKIEQMSHQKKKLKDILGTHCQKVTTADSVMSKERVMLVGLHQQVRRQIEQASQLLVDSNKTVLQLAHLVQQATQDLNNARYAILRDKAKFLHTTTSMNTHKMDQLVYKDQDYTKAINNLGDSLKMSLDGQREHLKSLQKSLKEYQKKEESSNKYKEIVSEYTKTKRHLHHKYQTLNVLNEPDVSFS